MYLQVGTSFKNRVIKELVFTLQKKEVLFLHKQVENGARVTKPEYLCITQTKNDGEQ